MTPPLDLFRTPSGRVAYRRALADTATELYLTRRQLQDAQKQLDQVPKCVMVLCRIVGRLMRGRGSC